MSVRDLRADAIKVATGFYVLESLDVIVSPNFGNHSGEKLKKDIKEFKDLYAKKTSEMLFDYSVLALFGEVRHSNVYTLDKHDYDWETDDTVILSEDRSSCYRKAVDFDPMHSLYIIEKVFSCMDWRSGYGGDKWAYIANRTMLKGSIPNNVYCDICFSLSHNNSPYLDKSSIGIFKISGKSRYEKMLDYKLLRSPELFVLSHMEYCGEKIVDLIKRAQTLGFLKVSKSFVKADNYTTRNNSYVEDGVINYKPIKFGNKKININIPSRAKTVPQKRPVKGSYLENYSFLKERYSFKKGESVLFKDNLDIKTGIVEKHSDLFHEPNILTADGRCIKAVANRIVKKGDLVSMKPALGISYSTQQVVEVDSTLGVIKCRNRKGDTQIHSLFDGSVINEKNFQYRKSIYDGERIGNMKEDIFRGQLSLIKTDVELGKKLPLGTLVSSMGSTGIVKTFVSYVSPYQCVEIIGKYHNSPFKATSNQLSEFSVNLTLDKTNIVKKIKIDDKNYHITEYDFMYLKVERYNKQYFLPINEIDFVNGAWFSGGVLRFHDNRIKTEMLIPWYEGIVEENNQKTHMSSLEKSKSYVSKGLKVKTDINSYHSEMCVADIQHNMTYEKSHLGKTKYIWGQKPQYYITEEKWLLESFITQYNKL